MTDLANGKIETVLIFYSCHIFYFRLKLIYRHFGFELHSIDISKRSEPLYTDRLSKG